MNIYIYIIGDLSSKKVNVCDELIRNEMECRRRRWRRRRRQEL